MGCNFGCKHCYLGPKPFSGLTWPERDRLLHLLRDAGVVWLQLTGGEPTIDPHFLAVYQRASELGMMLEILTNGSRLHYRPILEALIAQRPHRITVSLYGATETSFDELTQRRGAWNSFIRGLDAAQEASLPIDVSIIVTRDNADELDAMKAFTEDRGLTYGVFSNMSPTIGGKDLPLSSQVPELIRKRPPFTGCDAGRTSMHIDPHGKASTCKIARTPSIDLLSDGLDGLARLAGISDDLLQRTRGCSGCKLSGTCSTCTPLAELYRSANASRAVYCQHPDPAPDAPERR
nr:radical SAM protein [Nocardiopsis mwathae]